ncbi:MAG TPA: hypothetical protein VF426_06250 [Marmoricola sp.]
MRYAKGFAKFWYDFLVGDDPKIAVGVVVVLAAGAVVVGMADYDTHVVTAALAVCIAVAFTVVVLVDVRRSGD